MTVDKTTVKPGESFVATVEARVQPGWHLYSTTQDPGGPVPTSIKPVENQAFEPAGSLQFPPPHKSFDQNFGIETEYYEGHVPFKLPLRAKANAARGQQELAIKVRYMLCSDTLCLPPQTETLKTQLTIETVGAASAGEQTAAPASALPSAVGASPPGAPVSVERPGVGGPESAASKEAPVGSGRPAGVGNEPSAGSSQPAAGLPLGALAYIWFAMAMGGLALLTPCVFPMIPITVSYFTKRQSATPRHAVWEAFMYSVGIILTFTLLGFMLTFLFGAGGINRLAASSLVNVLIALVFIVFALSLFGAFEIRLPSRWLTAVDKQSARSRGLVGILLMALTFSLTSFTCTVPFVGTVMVAALQGDWLWSLLGVTVFAAVFSAPFFLLAVFPSWLKSLPKSGNWMNSLKITMGFLELAAAMKFVSNVDLVYQWEVVTRPVFIAVWLALALVTAMYLLGWFRLPHEMPGQSVGVFRVFSAIFFLAVAFYLFRGLLGFPLGELDAFLPPRDYGGVHAAVLDPGRKADLTEGRWLDSYAEGLETARRENRPVFVDFTGYTCTNCRWMESNMFPQLGVQSLLSRFVLVRLYTDGPEAVHERNLEFERERFGTIALPYYAIMSPDDQVIATFPGLTRDPSAFVSFLKKGLRPTL
ncbi:MAG: protein-disulfide reductase DsbD family protein [Acidobacteriota bacterium]